MQLCFGVGVPAVVEDVVEHTAEEGVARAGGLDGVGHEMGGHFGPDIAAVGAAAVFAEGEQDKRDVEPAAQPSNALVVIRTAGEPLNLVVGDFEDLAVGHAVEDLLPGVAHAVPEGFPEVGVKAEQCAGLFGQRNGLPGGGAARLVGHGEGTVVEDLGVGDQLPVQLVGGEIHVRTGVAVEAELPVAVRMGVDDRQRGMHHRVAPQAAGVDADFGQRIGQLVAETVLPDFAEKGSLVAQLGQQGQHVAGRAAGVGFQQGIALRAQAVLGKVDQQLAQCGHIILLHLSFPPAFRTAAAYKRNRKPGRAARSGCSVRRSEDR